MQRESVYNQTVSEEGRKHDLLRVCGVSNSSCQHSKESQISGPTVIKHMVLIHTTLQAVRWAALQQLRSAWRPDVGSVLSMQPTKEGTAGARSIGFTTVVDQRDIAQSATVTP